MDGVRVDRGGGASQIILIKSTTGLNPSSATNYYFGMYAWAGAGAVNRIYFRRDGVIHGCGIGILTGVTGTSETSSFYIRLNNTTDYLVTSAVANNATTLYINNSSLAIPIADGDYIEFKWLTPTWSTPPTVVYIGAVIDFI